MTDVLQITANIIGNAGVNVYCEVNDYNATIYILMTGIIYTVLLTVFSATSGAYTSTPRV